MKLKGSVTKIFSSNGNGFTLFALKVDDITQLPQDKINPNYPTSVSVTGKFPDIDTEYVLEVTGDWFYRCTDKKYHPWQFQAKSYRICENESPVIVKRQLQKIDGVGEAFAEKIYAKFGLQSFDVIETKWLKLTEIKGINNEKAEVIHNSYIERKSFQYLMDKLSPYGISETKVKSIQKSYSSAYETIMENPYCLANDDFVSFKIADTIASDMGFEAANDYRIESLIFYVLDKIAAGQGHTYLEVDDLSEKAAKILNSPASAIEGKISEVYIRQKINDFVQEKILVNENGKIYKTYRYKNEVDVAQHIAKRLKLHNVFYGATEDLIEECVDMAQKFYSVTLAEKQKEAVIVALHNLTTIITGGPGTGKTTTLKCLLKAMDFLCEKMNITPRTKILAAPTGMAAKRMKEATSMPASTLHRLLDYVPFKDGEIKCKNEEDPIEGDIIIVDESSMLDIDLSCMLIKAVKDVTMLVLVGDIDQLPSVGPGNVLHDLIESGFIPTVKLNCTYRQGQDSSILKNATKINHGDTDIVLGKDDFQFYEIPDSENDLDGEELTKKVLQVFAEQCRIYDDINQVQILCPMRKRSEFIKSKAVVNELNPLLQETVNSCLDDEMAYGKTRFRQGDKVMQLQNNYDKGVFNGDVGVILDISQKTNRVKIDYQGVIVEYTKSELDQIQHSFATTIHKSQGSEYACVIMPITMQHKMMLQRNLIYTGITRAKKRVIIIGDREALNYAIINVSNKERNSTLIEKLKEYCK